MARDGWTTFFSYQQVDVGCFSFEQVDVFCFSFLLPKGTDSWSLLYSRHRDSTDPAGVDVPGITEEDFEEKCQELVI